MSVSGQVSVSSSIGTSLVFTVTGTQTLAYATRFQNILLGAGTVKEAVLNGDTPPATVSGATPNGYTLNFNEITAAGSYTLPGGEPGAITFVDQNSAATVTGSGAGDYVLFTGINPSNTYVDVGGGNTVIFTTGDNTYEGGQTTGTDYIVAGSGHDTINTGLGSDQVFSGTGQATINLNDATSQTTNGTFSGIFNDLVILNDGVNTVNAGGTSDDIVATASGQTIVSTSTVPGAAAIVSILGSSTNDLIFGGSATIAVFDSVGGNEFVGDSVGQAYFIAGPNVSDLIQGGGGHSAVYAFGNSNSNITLFDGNGPSDSISGYSAGLGNETLNAAGFSGPLEIFANNTSSLNDAAAINETLVGGSGLNAFVTGEGNESIVGGGAALGNEFYIQHTNDNSDMNTGTITISNFANTNWEVFFGGYTQAEITQSESSATVGTLNDPSYTIKLSDGTTVQFLGVNSLSGHGG